MVKQILLRVLRAPTLHFTVLGLVAFLTLRDLLAPPQVLVIDREVVEQTERDWQQLQRGPLSEEQRQRMAEQLARSAILVDVARKAGLDRSPAVEQRLLKLARFLDLVEPGSDDAAAIAAARELDLHRTDPVVRRYLETTAEFVLSRSTGEEAVAEETVHAYYREHAEDFRIPGQRRLSHVFFSGADARQRAQQLRARIEREELPPHEAIGAGDAFYGGHEFGLKTRRQLASLLGDGFADAAWEVPRGQWSEPIESAFGIHLVWMAETVASRQQPLEQVRADIVTRLQRERRREALERRVADLRNDYRIVGLNGLGG